LTQSPRKVRESLGSGRLRAVEARPGACDERLRRWGVELETRERRVEVAVKVAAQPEESESKVGRTNDVRAARVSSTSAASACRVGSEGVLPDNTVQAPIAGYLSVFGCAMSLPAMSVMCAGSRAEDREGGHCSVSVCAYVTPLLTLVQSTEGGCNPLKEPPHPRLVPFRCAAKQRKPHIGKVERYLATVEVKDGSSVAHGYRRHGE